MVDQEGKALVDFFTAVAQVMEKHQELANAFMLIPVESLRGQPEAGDELVRGAKGGPERAAQAFLSARVTGRKICGVDPRTGRIIYC